MAIGDRNAASVDSTYTNAGYVSQHPWDHVEGAPFGTRGGIVVDHVFPADAEYVFEVQLVSGSFSKFEDVDISIDGERVALLAYQTGRRAAPTAVAAAPSAPNRSWSAPGSTRWRLRSSARLTVPTRT